MPDKARKTAVRPVLPHPGGARQPPHTYTTAPMAATTKEVSTVIKMADTRQYIHNTARSIARFIPLSPVFPISLHLSHSILTCDTTIIYACTLYYKYQIRRRFYAVNQYHTD